MAVTARQLNRATLERQLLLRRAPLDAVEAVRAIMAVQAQEPASPYLALWNRVIDFDPAQLDTAFAEHRVVKATLMRITLHAVHADDYRVLHHAMQRTLRAARLNDQRFAATGLTADAAHAFVPDVLAFLAQPRTNAEIDAFFIERFGEQPKPGPWWAFRSFASVVHAPTGGPWTFGPRPSYRAARGRPYRGDTTTALQHLGRRYLQAFGPATVQDIAQFAMLHRPPLRAALDAIADELVTLDGPDGTPLLDVRGATLPAEDTPAPPRLMAMWDSTLLAYADRSRIIPSGYRAHVIRRNGDTLPTVLVDGYVAGVWRPVDGGIEISAFHELPDDVWDGLADEATRLTAFLADREPLVYKRYGRWWNTVPGVDVRVLPV